jgi:molybdopterin-containing oxidoreductase family iron-sulfur binding subunit
MNCHSQIAKDSPEVRKVATALREGRPIADGEVHTACEQSCPAEAILFGNLADPNSRVSRAAAAGCSYRVLEELNRQPAVHYLARVWNRDEQNG